MVLFGHESYIVYERYFSCVFRVQSYLSEKKGILTFHMTTFSISSTLPPLFALIHSSSCNPSPVLKSYTQ
ncbi:hypothetical protein L1887_14994 [Cichorium endivia]|nr:hypothetical protein L1887_14994 [Cichorium endivia]